jgi:hypothetical protein
MSIPFEPNNTIFGDTNTPSSELQKGELQTAVRKHKFSILTSNLTLICKKVVEVFKTTLEMQYPFVFSLLERVGVRKNKAAEKPEPTTSTIPIKLSFPAVKRAAMYGAEHLTASEEFAGLHTEDSKFCEHLQASEIPEIKEKTPLFKKVSSNQNVMTLVEELKIGTQLVVPIVRRSQDKSHAISVIFERMSQDTVNVTVINTGYGIDEYHNKVVPEEGPPRYNLAKSFDNVKISDLIEKKLFESAQSKQSIEHLYTTLQKIPHTPRTPRLEFARYQQIGGNCTIASQLEALRYLLYDCAQDKTTREKGKESYKKFKQEARYREFCAISGNEIYKFFTKSALVIEELQKKLLKREPNLQLPITPLSSPLLQSVSLSQDSPIKTAIGSNDIEAIDKHLAKLNEIEEWSSWGNEVVGLIETLYDSKKGLFKSPEFIRPESLSLLYERLFKDASKSVAFRFLPNEQQEKIWAFREHILNIITKTKVNRVTSDSKIL